MSRSIHTTWKDYWEKQRYSYSDREQQENELEEIRQALIRKRAIKKQRRSERKYQIADPLPPKTSESVNIEIRDQGDYVHYPLTEGDVRAVLEILPPGIADGLMSVTFCLGKEYMSEKDSDDPNPGVDPYTGRMGSEHPIPGIFFPPVLGSYNYQSNRIFIYAYVYDCQSLEDSIVESFLKLQMLNTFLHELAHHEDNHQRIARGRWLGSFDNRMEDYAYRRQGELASDKLEALLYDRYPTEMSKLSAWIKTHGGCSVSIREIIKGGIVFTVAEAVEDVIENVWKGVPKFEVKYRFANYLHYAAFYEEALSILQALLKEDPQNLETKTLMADIYSHQKDYDRAEPAAEEVLSEDPENEPCIFVLSEVYHSSERWPELIEVARKGQDITPPSRAYRFLWYLEKQLLAHLFLNNYNDAKLLLAKYSETSVGERRQQAFESLLLLATGFYAEALAMTNSMLSVQHKDLPVVDAVAKCVFNTASAQLGEVQKSRKLTSKDRSVLRNSKIGKLPFLKV
jgi:tetratricopeptide (TPR) repeat protein